jgi:hypothetical protein
MKLDRYCLDDLELTGNLQLNSVDPLAWLTDVLTKLVNPWPASRIDELMPYAAFRVMPRRST